MRKEFPVFMHSHFQAILMVRVFDILQPLLTNSVKEQECGATDGVPMVHVLLTKSAPLGGFMSAPGNFLRHQS